MGYSLLGVLIGERLLHLRLLWCWCVESSCWLLSHLRCECMVRLLPHCLHLCLMVLYLWLRLRELGCHRVLNNLSLHGRGLLENRLLCTLDFLITHSNI